MTRPNITVLRVINGRDERTVVHDSDIFDSLPPLAIPQEREPDHYGSTWTQPPRRSMWQEEIESPWLIRLYVYSVLAVVIVSALVARYW